MKNKLKNILKGEVVFIFLFLVLFPFGQIIRIGILQPIDAVAAAGAVFALIKGSKRPEFFKYLEGFLAIAFISWIYSLTIFPDLTVLYGLLYLFRLAAYIYFSIYVFSFIKLIKNKKLILNYLLGISVISALFGWLQLAVFPDIKPMFIWGWDIHLYRLVGTFFDPTFLGIIIVFGLLIALNEYTILKDKKYLLIVIFLLISLAFTYSRGSFLAFLTGIMAIVLVNRTGLKILVFGAVLILIAFILPTSKNKSVELFRRVSTINRIENYKQTINIYKKSPVFGIGYDNMCIAYRKYIGFQKFSSHACSGSDSSLLFILATTGTSGLMVLIYSLFKSGESLKNSKYKKLLIVLFAALITHSLFSNSLVYPWVLGYMLILLAAAA
jgi:O-antigen ligase